ncbi:MAG TPA: gamma-glutamyltransferase family protein [archaeon]|nr:gamma-glutamyltransferase family protein [archaeon]
MKRSDFSRFAIVLCCLLSIVLLHLISPIPAAAGRGTRPVVMGTHGVVASGHYLASELGLSVMKRGGNAVDAGVAMVLAQSLLEFQSFGFGGEVPTLVYSARDGKVYEISGNTRSPKAATIEWFKARGYEMIPDDGFLAAGVPAVLDALVHLLDRFGTMSFEEVATGAYTFAAQGFPMYPGLRDAIEKQTERFRELYPTSAAVFLPGGRLPELGEIYRNPDWAKTMKRLIQAERDALNEVTWWEKLLGKKADRHAGLMAVRDYYYKGPIAGEIVEFQRENKFTDHEGKINSGLLTVQDFADYRCQIGEPVSVRYRGYDVYKCGPWTQGPVFLQQLNILEGFNLKGMGSPNSVEYIHTWAEAAKLAHADKEKYYGDPDFVYVPMAGLLSKEYASERRKLVDPDHASLRMRPGDPYPYDTHPERRPADLDLGAVDKMLLDHGTTGTRAIDSQGNMFSATPSGGWIWSSPIIPGLGFCLGTRVQMFYLQEGLAKSLAGGKRPSTSLTPTLVMKDGRPLMVFGMPGGDLQDQGTLLCFLNIVDFGMDLQDALDAPKFWTRHFPSLFYPHKAEPGSLLLEGRIENLGDVAAALGKKGHKVIIAEPWTGDNTMVCMIDQEHGVLKAACNPRFISSYALAW